MKQQHSLIRGTLFLAAASLGTRVAGFFYKIFLSRTIGAVQIGIFQLTVPVYTFALTLSSGGIQTAISRFTAEYYAKGDKKSALRTLCAGLILSVSLSLVCSAFLFFGADKIAARFLLESDCAPLLRILSMCLPFSVIHGCVGGYFTGRKIVHVSAFSQLAEQTIRITTVLLVCHLWKVQEQPINASVMALGQAAGELAATIYCILCLFRKRRQKGKILSGDGASQEVQDRDAPGRGKIDTTYKKLFSRILSISAPLGLNHLLICVLQGIEASLLPRQLQRFGLDGKEALSAYGTLTGMALPLILFPTAVTGSLGTLLLPAVSEARALQRDRQISVTVNASFQGSVLLGCFSLAAFLLFGGRAGTLLFHNTLAGICIRRLAFLCPFLYINTTMMSILHALGKTGAVFIWNLCSFLLRLTFIVLLIPKTGIDGYLAGLIIAQFFITVCTLTVLCREHALTVSISGTVLKYGGLCILCGTAVFLLSREIPLFSRNTLSGMFLAASLYCALFGLPLLCRLL